MGKVFNKVDEIIEELKDDIKIDIVKLKKIAKQSTSKVLALAGNSEVDDKVITKALEAAIISGISSTSNGAVNLTTAQLDPIFSGAFEEINKKELELSQKLLTDN